MNENLVVNPTESLTSNPFEDPWIRMVGCARFWLPGFGSGSAKICGSTDPDPRVKNQPKTGKKLFHS